MGTEEEIALAHSEFNAARTKIYKCDPGKPGFGAEARYGETYQKLVLLGEKPQLKLKYRGR